MHSLQESQRYPISRAWSGETRSQTCIIYLLTHPCSNMHLSGRFRPISRFVAGRLRSGRQWHQTRVAARVRRAQGGSMGIVNLLTQNTQRLRRYYAPVNHTQTWSTAKSSKPSHMSYWTHQLTRSLVHLKPVGFKRSDVDKILDNTPEVKSALHPRLELSTPNSNDAL